MHIITLPMNEVPESWHERLYELTIPSLFAMSRWLHQDGSCYVAILWAPNTETGEWSICGWGCMTFEDEPHPVLGVYIDEKSRRLGYAGACIEALIDKHRDRVRDTGEYIYAVAKRFPKYKQLIERAGFKHIEWGWE